MQHRLVPRFDDINTSSCFSLPREALSRSLSKFAMVSALLDELPCIIDEADELMARLGQLSNAFQTLRFGTDRDGKSEADRTASIRQSEPSESTSSGSSETQASPNQPMLVPGNSLDTAIKFFGKHFLLSQPIAVDKLKAALPQPDSPQRELFRELATRAYHLMKRIHHWQLNTWETLTQHLADSSSLTFDNHQCIAALLLDTVGRYVKLNLMWSSFSYIPGLLSVFGFLQYLHKAGDSPQRDGTPALFSQLDHTDHCVREFVLCFGTNALLKIQQDFAQHPNATDLAVALISLLRSSLPRWLRCYDLAELRNRGVFDVDTLYHAGNYASHTAFLDIADTVRVPEWVLCVALCVPQYLRASPTTPSSGLQGVEINVTLWEAVQVILGDQFMMILHRDHVVHAHDLLYRQVMSCSATNISSTGKLSTPPPPPNKKDIKQLAKRALGLCADRRRQRREIVGHLLVTATKMLRHNPAFVGPLFPMLVATLTLSKGEIEWMLAHDTTSRALTSPLLPGFLKTKHWQRARFPDHCTELGLLLMRTHQLRGITSRCLPYVTKYYQEFLMCGDADGIAYSINSFIESSQQEGSAIDPRVVQLLTSFRDKGRYSIEAASNNLSGAMNGRRQSIPGSSWVREWQQATAYFAAAHVHLPEDLRNCVEVACKHVDYALADVNGFMERVASFSKTWWFRSTAERCFTLSLVQNAKLSLAIADIFCRFKNNEYTILERLDCESAHEHSSGIKELQKQILERMRADLTRQLSSEIDHSAKKRAARAIWHKPNSSHPGTVKQTDNPSVMPPSSQVQTRRPSIVLLAKGTSKHVSLECPVDDSRGDGDKALYELATELWDDLSSNRNASERLVIDALKMSAARLITGSIAPVDLPSGNGKMKLKVGFDSSYSLKQSLQDANNAWTCLRQTARRHFAGLVDSELVLAQELARVDRTSTGKALQKLAAMSAPSIWPFVPPETSCES